MTASTLDARVDDDNGGGGGGGSAMLRRPPKAVCCDLDGTLFDARAHVSDFTADVLRRVTEKGVRLIVATGRPYQDVFATIRKSGLRPDYIITSNGARVHDAAYDVVVAHDMDADAVCGLFQLARHPHDDGRVDDTCPGKRVVTNVNCKAQWLTDKCLPSVRAMFNECYAYNEVDPATLTPRDLVGTHSIWITGTHDDLLHVQRYIHRHYATRLWCDFSLPYILDCNSPHVSKGNALREVCQRLQLSLSDVACFGDGMNDASMLSIAGRAYVMQNAPPMVKAAVPHAEVVAANTEDGVAHKLHELFAL